MTRKTLKSLALALIAVFALGSVGEAAPRKVRHRPKHSTRVSSGTTTPATVRKKPPGKKRVVVRKSTTGKKVVAKRRPTTKPR